MEDGACLGVQRGQVSLAEVLWESLWKTFFSVANRSVVPTGVGRDSLWVWEERVSLHFTIIFGARSDVTMRSKSKIFVES